MNNVYRDIHFVNLIAFRIDLKKKSEKVWNTRCHSCGDSAKKKAIKRMYFLVKDDHVLVYCHNCGLSMKLRTYIKQFFPEYMDDYNFFGFKKSDKAEKVNADSLLEKLKESEPKKTSIPEKELIELTKDFKSLSDNHPAKMYVKRRKIPFNLVRYCNNFYDLSKSLGQDDTFRNYAIPSIIIPFFKKTKQIEIFQARFFDPKVKPKYLTVKLNPEAKKIYNEDFIDFTRTIWILEGPIDSMFVDNSVALAGSDGLAPQGDVVWVFDNEPYNNEISGKIRRKIDEGSRVVIWKKSDNFKDINEAIEKNILTKDDIPSILIERIQKGLQAKLEFAKWRS